MAVENLFTLPHKVSLLFLSEANFYLKGERLIQNRKSLAPNERLMAGVFPKSPSCCFLFFYTFLLIFIFVVVIGVFVKIFFADSAFRT